MNKINSFTIVRNPIVDGINIQHSIYGGYLEDFVSKALSGVIMPLWIIKTNLFGVCRFLKL